MALPTWTLQQVLGQLNSGMLWSGSTITYAFPTSAGGMQTSDFTETPGFIAADSGTQAKVKLALQLWDDLIAPSIQQTTSTHSDIEVAFSSSMTDFAHTYFPTYGSMWLSSKYTVEPNNLRAAGPESYGFTTYLHELGHALGLDHMGNYESSLVPSSYQDSLVYSVMSYFGPNSAYELQYTSQVAWANWNVGGSQFGEEIDPQTPMLNDIYAIQSMYGADPATRSGDTTYGFNSNITGAEAAVYDFSQNPNPVLTIYDAGGNDTLDLSGFSQAASINLNAGMASNAAGMTSNIWIAYDTTIENAVGGAGADVITGNGAANHLWGGAGSDKLSGGAGADTLEGGSGNDSLDGGSGIDTAAYGGTRASHTVNYNGGNWQVVTSGSDVDSLTGTERLQFGDGGLALDLSGNAGEVAKVLGAVFGASAVHNAEFVGIGLGLADTGMSELQLMQFALDAQLGPNAGYASVVQTLYTNVTGGAPDGGSLAYYTGLLSSHQQTEAELGVMAAETDQNAVHIGLNGLMTAGLAFV
jgi:serralysin